MTGDHNIRFKTEIHPALHGDVKLEPIFDHHASSSTMVQGLNHKAQFTFPAFRPWKGQLIAPEQSTAVGKLAPRLSEPGTPAGLLNRRQGWTGGRELHCGSHNRRSIRKIRKARVGAGLASCDDLDRSVGRGVRFRRAHPLTC